MNKERRVCLQDRSRARESSKKLEKRRSASQAVRNASCISAAVYMQETTDLIQEICEPSRNGGTRSRTPPRILQKGGQGNSTVKGIMKTEAQDNGFTISDPEAPLSSFFVFLSVQTQSDFRISSILEQRSYSNL